MARQVLPSKLISERITIEFDFLNQLQWGELLYSAEVVVVVEVGIDPLPHEMLYKVPLIIAGRRVSQQIYRGEPGVMYQVKCTVFTLSGNTYEQYVRLSILPDTAQLPLFLATYLTSRPYPVEAREGLLTVIDPVSGRLFNKFIDTSEGLSPVFSLYSGGLFGGSEEYDAPAEILVTILELVSGGLFGGIIEYDNPGEGIIPAMIPLQGEFEGGRVSYTHPSEGFVTQLEPLSGHLS